MTLPVGLYIDDDLYERERRAVFAREWMILGRTAELDPDGGYVAEDIAGYPVFVVLDRTGLPWGYHNVCPHRGGPILMPGRGRTESLTCRYHGWCFSFEGALVDAPGFEEVPEVRPGLQRLSEISMGRWAQLLWVRLEGSNDPIAVDLAALMWDTEGLDLDGTVFTGHETRIVRCNWKLVIENYLESYHVPHNHPVLAQVFDMAGSGIEILDDRTTVQRASVRGGDGVRWYFRYPNVFLQVLGSTVCWTQVLPRGPRETMLAMDFFTMPGVDDTPLRTLCDRLIAEDRPLLERTQANLAAGVHRGGYLNPVHERGVEWFRSLILTSTDLRSEDG